MTHQYHFTSSSIDPQTVDRLAERGGYDSRAEYFRALVRDDASDKNVRLD